jgi:hypothetical protein
MRSLGILLGTVVVAAGLIGYAQDIARRPAVRIDPISTIIDAFATHPVVALGEGPHGNEQGHAFRLALYRDPRFAAVVNDIVVESGSARYQDFMDRFVQGEAVPENELLQAVRENTVTPTPVWDRPMYDEMFRAVRDLNRSLPAERRLRILLGDPPIDWRDIRTGDDYGPWLQQRDSHPAEVIQREVLAKGRRALVVYGDGHFLARSERPGRSLVGILETGGTRVFTVASTFADLTMVQKEVGGWPTPWLASLKGTLLGAAPNEMVFGPLPPIDALKANPNIEDHFDAVVVLGAPESMTRGPLAYPRCVHPDYGRMRTVRMKIGGVVDANPGRLMQECQASAPPK